MHDLAPPLVTPVMVIMCIDNSLAFVISFDVKITRNIEDRRKMGKREEENLSIKPGAHLVFVSFLHALLVTNHFLFINCLFLGRANDKAFSKAKTVKFYYAN